MTAIANIVIGNPQLNPMEMFANSPEDWEKNEKPIPMWTDERNLALILKNLGVVNSISEIRRNKPELCKILNNPEYLEIKWGKHRFYILVGE